MKLQQLSLVASIMYKSKSPKIFLSIFIVISLILSLSIGAYFFTGNLLNSYSSMLQKSYLGFEPRFTLQSNDVEFLKEVESVLTQNSLKSSIRKIEKNSYTLSLKEKKLRKKITFYIYKDGYIDQRFHSEGGVYINKILENILRGTQEISLEKSRDQKLLLPDFNVIDTGFLTSEAIIFIDERKIKAFINSSELQAVLEIDDELSEETQHYISTVAKKLQILSYHYVDRLQSEEDVYENFVLFGLAKNIFLTILIGTIIVIILITQNIILELKEKSLRIILKMGMGLNEIIVIFLLLSSSIFIISTLAGRYVLSLFRSYYLHITNFRSDFFIDLVISDYYILFYLMFILLFFTIIINIIILRRNLK
ncbi:MAG: hypothetical protein JJW00_02575 [Sulfurimonas sp.]|nr:hypothetical protein [Sulfurimonas sp.]